MQDPAYVEKERARRIERYAASKHKKKNKAIGRAQTAVLRAIKIGAITKAIPHSCYHHWSYNKPDKLDVFLLPTNLHRRIHMNIKLNESRLMFAFHGILLDTREKHIRVMKSIAKKYADEIDFSGCEWLMDDWDKQ